MQTVRERGLNETPFGPQCVDRLAASFGRTGTGGVLRQTKLLRIAWELLFG
jgi:hypothetical protein